MNRWLIAFFVVVPFLFGGLILAGCVWLWMDQQRAAERPRASALRMDSGSKLKQLVLALQNYHDKFNAYPPAVVHDATGRPLYSGRVLLLPFMEQRPLFDKFDLSKAWDSPENLPVSQLRLKMFESPHKLGLNGRCDYVFVVGPGTAFPPGKNTNYGDIKDGVEQTLMMVETKNGPTCWAAPGDWEASSGPIPPGYMEGETVVGFADLKVFIIKSNPPNPHSRALCTIDGGEVVPIDQLSSR